MTWLNIALAFWGLSGWGLFWWVALRRHEPGKEWGYVVLLRPEDDDRVTARTVWCSKKTADRIRGGADEVHS